MTFQKPLRRTRGMTLLEVLIATSIQMLVFVGAVSVFVASARMQQDIYHHNVVDGEARKVEEWLVSDIRGAITLENSLTHSSTNYTASTSTLILRLPAVTASGDPVSMAATPSATASDFIVYYHDQNGFLHRLLVRHASSWREGRNTASEDRIMGRSTDPGIGFTSAFSAAPDVLGPIVVHYEFRASRFNQRRGKNPNPYTVAIAGSVYMRNRP